MFLTYDVFYPDFFNDKSIEMIPGRQMHLGDHELDLNDLENLNLGVPCPQVVYINNPFLHMEHVITLIFH